MSDLLVATVTLTGFRVETGVKYPDRFIESRQRHKIGRQAQKPQNQAEVIRGEQV